MNLSKFTLSLVGTIFVAGLVAASLVQRSARVQLGVKEESLRQQAEETTQLLAENERLSNRISQAKSSPSLSAEQFREVLRLRGEIGGLRRAGMESDHLQATNVQLRAALEASEQELAAARAAPNFWAKEQLGFAGYASPESGMKTVLWSLNRGDVESFVNCFTPETRAELEKHLATTSEAELAAATKEMQESLNAVIGFRVLNQTSTSAAETTLNVSFDGMGKTRKFTLRKVGEEWKLHQMGEFE